jgi:NhaP-type Na+/H+ or K+/H+ antiporter
VLLAVLGAAAISAAVLPRLVDRLPLSLPLIYFGLGLALFSLPIGLEGPRVGSEAQEAERLTEFVVIVSLMGAGLKLNRRVGWRSWGATWRLLGITMPLTIGGICLLALGPLGLPIASAVLLGAVLAPTDPVLASDVQVEGPAEEDADDEVRFALTSEAGLNDALAFPFTNLALALATASGGAWALSWFAEDVVLKLAVGGVVGWALGRLVAWLAFHMPTRNALANTSEGFVAIGATLAVYGIAEMLHGYGFLAVFVAAVTIRNQERDHEYQQTLHDFAETTERLASIVFLLLLGGAVVEGVLGALTLWSGAIAVVIVFVVRPLTGWLALIGYPAPAGERASIAFFGSRGRGTVDYHAHAATADAFPRAAVVWAVAAAVFLLSMLIHGVTATPVLRFIDRRRAVGRT